METKYVVIIVVVIILVVLFPLLVSLLNVNPAEGTWAYTVDTPLGPFPQTLTLNADMSGTISVTEPEAASWPITNAKLDGKSLSYIVKSEVGGQAITFEFKGNVEGDVITGVYASVLGNSRVTGTRK